MNATHFKKDPINDSMITNEVEHFQIHNQTHYFVSELVTLAVSATAGWLFTTPNTASGIEIHLLEEVRSSLNGGLFVYENASITSAGTTLTALNSDRGSANVTSAEVQSLTVGTNITTTGFGTLIDSQVIGTDGATPNGDRGGFFDRSQELILKQNEEYFIRYLSESASNRVSIKFNWYEM